MKKKIVIGVIIFIVSVIVHELAHFMDCWWVLRAAIKGATTVSGLCGLHMAITVWGQRSRQKKAQKEQENSLEKTQDSSVS